MNRRWQEYSSQKEKNIEQLKSAATVSGSACKVDRQREKELLSVTEALGQQVGHLEDEKKQVN